MITAKEAIIQALLSEGVDHVFGLPGSSEIQFMDTLEDHPEIRYILGLHECIAAGMAVGYARASGKVGVLNFHTFAGMGAAMSTLLDAYRGGVPLIVTAGHPDNRSVIQEGSLTADLVSLGRNFAKWSVEIAHADNLALIMQRAFKVARQHPTGPVFISLPQNIMNDSLDFKYVASSSSSLSRKRPDQESINRVADLLAKAKKPVVISGTNAAKDRAIPEVVELVEKIGAYAYSLFMGSDMVFPTNHPQFMGPLDTRNPDTRRLLESVDAVVTIGAQVPATISNAIQIDNDPWELGKNWPIMAGIEGDIRLSVAELNSALEKELSPEDRLAAGSRAEGIAREKEAITAKRLAEIDKEDNGTTISAHRLARELAQIYQPDMVIVDESWSYSTTIQQYIGFSQPNSYIRSRGPSIGQGMPIALGVKLAMPDHQVVALVGDGSAIWSFQSLWTAAHYNIPVKFVILHNASYRLVKLNKIRQMGEPVRGRFLGMDLNDPIIDFCQLARGMGITGQRVDQPEELAGKLLSIIHSDKPEMVEVIIEGKM